MTSEPATHPKPLGELVEGPPLSPGENLAAGLGAERRVIGAAFAPLNSARRLAEGVEGGAFAVFPLVLVHGVFAAAGLFAEDWRRLVTHGVLTVAAIVAYYAVLKGRAVWPSGLVLAWLIFEIAVSPWLLDYRWGASAFNLIGLPGHTGGACVLETATAGGMTRPSPSRSADSAAISPTCATASSSPSAPCSPSA
jgi:hypothetical protein